MQSVFVCVVTQNTVILALAQPALTACGWVPAFVLLISTPPFPLWPSGRPKDETRPLWCCALLSALSVCHVSWLSSLLWDILWFSVMEDDEEEFPNTRTDEFLHSNNGKEKREEF